MSNITIEEINQAMKSCPQTNFQTVWEHGESVTKYLKTLVDFINSNETELKDWKIPSWIFTYRSNFLSSIAKEQILYTYTLYHDCGKPYCRIVDKEGKQHFPNHANVSYDKWMEIKERSEYHQEIGNLIKHDMDIHTMSAEDVETFCNHENAASLLLAGLAEIHSNSAMFGGKDSVSFKIKWKQIDKRGKAICEKIFGKGNK